MLGAAAAAVGAVVAMIAVRWFQNVNPIDSGSALHTRIMKTEALKQALDRYGFDAAIGGARRDE